ncbi:MAG: hypothetical protein J5860_01025, partial [Clostridia bacterium]|nr:hypothetical protein [Clostridia bacterium]
MKKYLATLLAFIMIFTAMTVIAPVSSLAAATDDDDIGVNVPDDAFEGGYVEFKGKDGSVTRVFDNGSVSTKNKDGSYVGVDYKGNQYAEDKKGNYTVHTTDGYIATEYKDGRKALTEPNGKTTTMNTDDSFSESYATLGVTVDYDAEGHRTGIGFTGSDKRIETDEDGYFKNGEIKGKNGQSLVITDNGAKLVNSEGTEYNFTSSLNKEEVSVKWKDGAHCESTTTTTWNNGERTENTDFSLTESNGDRWDANLNVTFDKDGNPQYSNNHVTQFTGADGSTLWIDNNSKAVEFKDPNTGSTFITDKNGNLLENKSDEVNFKATYDENGNLTNADITWKDGARQVQNADGSTTFTLPDGTKYESDGKGNVYKDGKQIRKDGEWMPGEGPEATTTASTTSTTTKELWKEDAAL